MRRPAIVIPFLLVMVAVVVAVDVTFLRGHPGPRLIVNIAVVLVFAAVYFRFFRRR